MNRDCQIEGFAMAESVELLKGNGPGRGPALDQLAEAEGFREAMDRAAVAAVTRHALASVSKSEAD